ncbi:MAG: diguanylate cyclase domain-containing protein [Gemmatimonadota bacterium]
MQGDRPRQGYDLLTLLRKLETRIARLDKRWRAFRADPRPERLEQFRRTFEGTDRALEALASCLAGSEEIGPGTDARTVVEAGRTLDSTLAEVTRAWGYLRTDPDPSGLDGLADRLARAEAAAAILGLALPPGVEAREPADSQHSPPRPAKTGSLDTLLRRVHDDWQTLRRRPAPDRVGVLRGELAEARAQAEGLRTHLQGGAPPDPEQARYLTGASETVRFAPYRDAFTGLYNRAGFDALAGAELKRCRRYSRDFGLLLLEVQPVDLVDLRATLATLQSLLRGYDLLSRYADRLVVVGLPETDAAETRRIAARLLRAMEESNQVAVRRLSYALMPDDGASLSALLKRAEDRLSA